MFGVRISNNDCKFGNYLSRFVGTDRVGFLIYIGRVYSDSLGGFGRREPLSFNSMAENNEPSQV